MSQTLYPYYERELLAIRQLAQEFAQQYPAAAGRLMLEPSRSTDPHVERLLEGFALLAGRIHHKLDDEFPELTDGLLNVLYPHYLAPVPSCLVAQFVADAARAPLLDGFVVPRHSELVTAPVNDLRCRYRTVYPVTLWPINVLAARLQGPPWQSLRLPAGFRLPEGTAAVLQIQLECQAGAKFSDLSLDTLRLHLVAENQLSAELYELLLNHVSQVTLVPVDQPTLAPFDLPPHRSFAPVGFEAEEGMFPYPPQSFPGYRLLTEFFAFPAKFWFVDVPALGWACRAGFGRRVDLLAFLRRTSPNLEKAVNAATFRLGCTPAVNLFEQTAEPIPLTQARFEYRVTPQVDQPNGMEVYSVDQVTGVEGDGAEPIEYRPFYDITHPNGRGREAYWYASRRASTREGDRGTEVYLNLVDRGWDPQLPPAQTLVVRTTCTNRELPAHLQRAGDQLALELRVAAPISAIHCVRSPTLPLRPPRRRRGSYWRLLSHLSLNHLSITDAEEGRLALQEILRLYDFTDPESGHQRAEITALLIEGLVGVSARRVVGRVATGEGPTGFCRGVEVTIELDEEKYVGTGAFLFASVLERFLGLYATVNSFTQLVAKTKQGERVIKRWPPRAGDKPLL